ncbi:MAG: LysM peptidoglycan-binding domain-containing protein, partial [Thermoanaerobaculia bacterium]|nr:LysM peptidoglycan-binding domain-containing protein [Thermoanaerobaculia bacterium]
IKCGKGWKSDRYFKDDDERNKKGERIHSCFRKYDSVVECFADHSEFIRNPEKKHRYGFLFELDPLDYKAWARGLQEAGYSSVHYYADRLIFFIERYGLHEYDALAVNGRVALKRLAQVNDVKMVQARDGETLSDIAELYQLPLENLLQYNDFGYAPDKPPGMGAWVYVQNKRDRWNGPATFHLVEQEQSLFDIAQRYGLQIATLQKMNGLQSGEEPAAGERLRLRGKPAPGEKVQLRTGAVTTAEEPGTVRDTGVPAVETLAANGFIVEMLPEEPLAMPVPVHWPAVSDSARATPVDPSVLLLEHEDPAPLIVFDTATGKTETYHTVSRGDTLYSIARKYGVSTHLLRKMNRMKDNVVKIGQSLRVN